MKRHYIPKGTTCQSCTSVRRYGSPQASARGLRWKGIYMKITRPIRAVLFDMDGVMVDSEFVYMKYLLEFAKEKNPAVTMEDINPMVGRSRQDSWTVMERAVNNGESWESLIKSGQTGTFTAGSTTGRSFARR